MEYSDKGLSLTQTFEGLRLNAYQDGGGVWTIGYGHTKDVKKGDVISAEQAASYLKADVAEAVVAVNKYVTVPITQNQFDALVDFTFNLGVTAFRYSTLLRLLNGGNTDGAAMQFKRWDHDNGVVVAGLTKRRKAEEVLFTS